MWFLTQSHRGPIARTTHEPAAGAGRIAITDSARMDRSGQEGGGGGGIRTPDTGIMIPLLYQLSYTAQHEAIGRDGGAKNLGVNRGGVKPPAHARLPAHSPGRILGSRIMNRPR